MTDGKFATSVSCMDGRIQSPLVQWIKKNHPIDFVDVITEPGIDKKISEDSSLNSIRAKIEISINAHKSKLIVVSGHYDCAGNPVSDGEHISQIKKGVEIISSWNLGVNVIGIWVDNSWNPNLV
jgi:carbonic anhydrase